MIKHTSAVSGDLPEYLQGRYELSNPVRPRVTPAKGRKNVLNQVSSDAPTSFLLRHIQPSSPDARKNAFLSVQREGRLIQDLKCSKYQEFSRFGYEDFYREGPTVDYGTLTLSTAADLLKGNGAGARAKLPYYQAYRKAMERRQFTVKQGVFSYRSRQKAAGRADGGLLRSLRSVSTARGQFLPTASKESPSPKAAYVLLDSSLRTSNSSFRSRSVRAVLGSSKHLRFSRSPVHSPVLNTSKDIEDFDRLRRSEPMFQPITKKSLGLSGI